MGLATMTERPRNWVVHSHEVADALGAADNNRALPFDGEHTQNTIGTRNITFPYDIVIERIWFQLSSNTLDALSTNTFTLAVNDVATTDVFTLTDATSVAEIIELAQIGRLITRDQTISMLWLSDSVGTATFRIIGMAYRIVNPRA